MTIDQDKLGELLGRFVGDLGATIAAGIRARILEEQGIAGSVIAM